MWRYGFSRKELLEYAISLIFWTIADVVTLGVWITQGRFTFTSDGLNEGISMLICVIGFMVISGWIAIAASVLRRRRMHEEIQERIERLNKDFKNEGDT